jgi:hypothetical protein
VGRRWLAEFGGGNHSQVRHQRRDQRRPATSPAQTEVDAVLETLTLDALRQAVATVAPSRLAEFFQDIQDAFSQAGDEDSVFPIRHFHQRWGATIAIERRPSVAARLHAAEHALADTAGAVARNRPRRRRGEWIA